RAPACHRIRQVDLSRASHSNPGRKAQVNIMGDGGTVVIVNATKYNWQRTYQHSYQMNSWNFPEVVGAWEKVTVYVEWDQNVFDNWGDDGGEAEYTFQDPNGKLRTEKFQFQARWPGGGVGGYSSPDQR